MITTNLPISYLSHLSKEIANGRALHALAVANEYLSFEHPLRKALIQKALQHNPELVRHPAFAKLTAGGKFNELAERLKLAVQSEHAPRLNAERRRYTFNGVSRRCVTNDHVLERRGETTSRTRSPQVTAGRRVRRLAV
jgi:hypothetical protein